MKSTQPKNDKKLCHWLKVNVYKFGRFEGLIVEFYQKEKPDTVLADWLISLFLEDPSWKIKIGRKIPCSVIASGSIRLLSCILTISWSILYFLLKKFKSIFQKTKPFSFYRCFLFWFFFYKFCTIIN